MSGVTPEELLDHVTGLVSPEEHAKRPTQCPACSCADLHHFSLQKQGLRVWQTVACQACNSTWLDIYQLQGYDALTNLHRGSS